MENFNKMSDNQYYEEYLQYIQFEDIDYLYDNNENENEYG